MCLHYLNHRHHQISSSSSSSLSTSHKQHIFSISFIKICVREWREHITIEWCRLETEWERACNIVYVAMLPLWLCEMCFSGFLEFQYRYIVVRIIRSKKISNVETYSQWPMECLPRPLSPFTSLHIARWW